ncbi:MULTISPECIES: hypothetical protein [Micrococcaceae]|jgi:hypothetical protein|uniref:hypothetical protein n=1 Tax=Micrococcaceae TaxID=1268 RepID=UPI0008DE8116|nr:MULTISPECIES: hypothetical protein [Micrococcaceae]MDQ0095838.1 hypothetical protein [Paeniglutamicibacter psychrophenolicus]OIH86942.1 hypothetical protein BLJ79_03060 [Arthrobacter sp. UCD-GKA]
MARSNRPSRSSTPAPRSGRVNKWTRPEAAGDDAWLEKARYGVQRLQDAPDGQWHVRRISAVGASKTYKCPGCGRFISPGTEHLVAWRADHWSGDDASAAARRHWHPKCWESRSYRY